MRRELGQLCWADGLVEGGAGRNRQLEERAPIERTFGVPKRSHGYGRVPTGHWSQRASCNCCASP